MGYIGYIGYIEDMGYIGYKGYIEYMGYIGYIGYIEYINDFMIKLSPTQLITIGFKELPFLPKYILL